MLSGSSLEYRYVDDVCHVVPCAICHLFLWWCSILLYDYHSLFIRSLVDEHFQFFTTMNKVAMNILILPFCCRICLFLQGIYLGGTVAKS